MQTEFSIKNRHLNEGSRVAFDSVHFPRRGTRIHARTKRQQFHGQGGMRRDRGKVEMRAERSAEMDGYQMNARDGVKTKGKTQDLGPRPPQRTTQAYAVGWCCGGMRPPTGIPGY